MWTNLSEYLAPAFCITAPIDDYSTNRIYINNANNYTDLYYFTTLAHEGYPGHLYQTIQSYDYGLPPIRSLFNYPAYTEGWATYVEMLAYYYAGLPKDQDSACCSTIRLPCSAFMPVRISVFTTMDGKRRICRNSGKLRN
ncbi:MAG: DUF885 family protein [Roseburia sp.]